MVARVTTLPEFKKIINNSKFAVLKGHGLALIETAQLAKQFAIENAIKNFKDAKPTKWRELTGRKLTGQLLKSIRVSFEVTKAQLPKAFLTVSGIPYGAIHEFGGVIKPKKAKHLWIKIDYKNPYKRMTPTEFMEVRGFGNVKQARGHISYRIFKPNRTLIAAEIKTFKRARARVRTLFVLKDQVTIPERPYLRPAAAKAAKGMTALSSKRIAEELRKRGQKTRGR